jgi:copper(I)-binding protein
VNNVGVKNLLLCALFAGASLLGGMAGRAEAADTLQVREAYVREMPPGQSTSAGFMKLVNPGKRPVALIGATSDGAGAVEIHRHRHENGMMQMERVTRLEVPAQGQLVFAPGGYHLMLINLKRSYRAGDKINITLLDEEGKSYAAVFPVVNVVEGGGVHH